MGTDSKDYSRDIAVDANDCVLITGWTDGDLLGINAGARDAFLTKYDNAGNLLWAEQLGTSAHDSASSIAVDDYGNVFISGMTEGDLGNINPTYLTPDAYLAKYDTEGNQMWISQIGTWDVDHSESVAVDNKGNILITGMTNMDFGGGYYGESIDVFIAKFTAPEPASMTLLGLGGLTLIRKR